MNALQKLMTQYKAQGLGTDDTERAWALSKNELDKFRTIAQQRLLGVPWEYITGEVTFCGRRFCVDERVYIPNPETEIMVRAVMAQLKPAQTVVDLGTGCGNIAITIKKEYPRVAVVATDISCSALEVAQQNATRHKVIVKLVQSCHAYDLALNPQVIVANLPYGDKNHLLEAISYRKSLLIT